MKKWHGLFSRLLPLRRSRWAACVFSVLVVISLTSEMWANNKPIAMSYGGAIYFPVWHEPTPSRLQQSRFTIDYRSLKTDWAIWPVVRWDPYESNVDAKIFPSPPSARNWWGTDDRGRDLLTRIVYGIRYSLSYAILVWLLAYAIGIAVGGAMGYWGGRVDLLGQRFVEMVEAVPTLLLLLAVAALSGSSLTMLVIVSVSLRWTHISWYARAEFMKLRNEPFVESARASGVPPWRVLIRHLAPNSLAPIIALSPYEIATGVTALTVLDYLGLGLPPPTASLGELLQQSLNEFTIAWWLALFPALTIVVLLVCLTFIGDGVRVAYDPYFARQKAKPK